MEHLWVVIVLIATALQTARNAGQKRLAEELSAASATWVRFVFGLPIAAIYCLVLWNAHDPHIGILNIEFFIVTSELKKFTAPKINFEVSFGCLLYTSDAADE